MGELIPVKKRRSLSGQFNRRRADEKMVLQNEIQHLEKHAIKNPTIRECNPDSIGDTLLEAGALGLSLHPSLAHAYPIPYKINGEQHCCLTVGYRGMLHQVHSASTIRDVQANLVRENDPVFEVWSDINGRQIKHVEARKNRGKVTHAYCIAHYTNGGHHVEVMDEDELNACEKAASARNRKGGAVWRGPFRGEMQKKSVIRRAWKHWPKDPDGVLERVMRQMDEQEPMDFEAASADPKPAPEGGEILINEDGVNEIRSRLDEVGLAEQKVCKAFGIAQIEDLPQRRYDECLERIEDYRSRKESGKGDAA